MPSHRATIHWGHWSFQICVLAAFLAGGFPGDEAFAATAVEVSSTGEVLRGADNQTVVPPKDSIDPSEATEEEADKLYWQEKYSDASPLFRSLLPPKIDSTSVKDPVVVHRIKNLADSLAHEANYKEAGDLYARLESLKRKGTLDDSLEVASLVNDLAACEFYQGQLKSADQDCQRAIKIFERAKSPDQLALAKISLELGEIRYALSDYLGAIPFYKRAAALYDATEADVVEPLTVSVEGLAACYWHSKDYKSAEPYFLRLAELERTLYGDRDTRYGWALMFLSGDYQKLGKFDEAQPLYQKAIYIFRLANYERLRSELTEKGPVTQTVLDNLYTYTFGTVDTMKSQHGDKAIKLLSGQENKFVCPPSNGSLEKPGPWKLAMPERLDPPGWVWLDATKPRRANVVCIHGLGLNAQSYSAFGKTIAERGFETIAFDVRGFGQFAASKGSEKVDFKGVLEDLGGILKMLRTDNPGVPLFLLGESMGGAIALQVAAMHPDLIDGLICSVPAGSRYKAPSTRLSVAVHLVKNKNRPFNIGQKVVEQATSKTSLKDAWEQDPFNRLMLSPKELVQYQSFMNQNKAAAAKIKTLPVIFFQGGLDQLIKPKGTFALFRAVATKDKDLVLVGASEHLIFEEDQCTSSVAAGVTGWMMGHIEDGASSIARATAPNVQ